MTDAVTASLRCRPKPFSIGFYGSNLVTGKILLYMYIGLIVLYNTINRNRKSKRCRFMHNNNSARSDCRVPNAL